MNLRVERKRPGWKFLGIRFDGTAIAVSVCCLWVLFVAIVMHEVGRGTSTGNSPTVWAGLSDIQVITPSEDTAWTLQIGSEKPFNITFGDITYRAFARLYGYSWSNENRYETGLIPFKGRARIPSQERELHFSSSENLIIRKTTAASMRRGIEIFSLLLLVAWVVIIRRGHRGLVTSDRLNAEMASRPHGQEVMT